MAEAPKEIFLRHPTAAHRRRRSNKDISYTRTDLFTRALSAAKEAAGELEALHKAKIIPRGSGEILEMVKAEIEELEGE